MQDVPHFYNSEALHEFAVELFFKVWKGKKGEGKKTPIAQNAPFKYKPEFPRSALSLVVGMVRFNDKFLWLVINYTTDRYCTGRA